MLAVVIVTREYDIISDKSSVSSIDSTESGNRASDNLLHILQSLRRHSDITRPSSGRVLGPAWPPAPKEETVPEEAGGCVTRSRAMTHVGHTMAPDAESPK
ncbi:hypothetical protein NDU88_007397 [Pleurodeles waltl]|uniref:Uncharacterized protein n=1 Tax=Pleurodeles waltl TaxID=8319 RepID=A0AAV7LUG4_PLEWA|nr:hypothetical protein NDU88_007397 [Pleurodeles waltl]